LNTSSKAVKSVKSTKAVKVVKVKSETFVRLSELRASVRRDLAELKSLNEFYKQELKEAKLDQRIAQMKSAEVRREAAITKAKAKLDALMSPLVGGKARKASRKPGPVTVTTSAV